MVLSPVDVQTVRGAIDRVGVARLATEACVAEDTVLRAAGGGGVYRVTRNSLVAAAERLATSAAA